MFVGSVAVEAVAQPNADPAAGVPGFWDPRRRPERPDLSRITIIRFLTETDYPPFNFTGPDGNPAGFNVDLARMICDEIKVTCTVQMRRFETLLDAISSNRGDAIIASLAVTPQLRARLDFSDPYYRVPARFVSLHFLFTEGSFNQEIPFDPAIYFFADEIAIALRAYTLGYDLFHPHRILGWHLYDRTTRATHWWSRTARMRNGSPG